MTSAALLANLPGWCDKKKLAIGLVACLCRPMKKLLLLPFLATVALAADAAPVVAPVAHLSTAELVSAAITAISLGVAYWRNSKVSDLKKTIGSIAVSVESFCGTKAGQEVETQLKSTIAATAKKHGVGDLLDDIVQEFTPAATEEISKLIGPSPAQVLKESAPVAPAIPSTTK